mgnify:CR=1 FL=1
MRELKNHPSPDQLDSYDKYPCYYENDLELVYTPQQSIFTLWAPSADNVRLTLYSSGEAGDPEEQLEMDIADNGTWCIHIDRDLKGSFYTFQIEKDGKWLDETPGIWAKAVGINGNRAAVIDWNETNPEGWESDQSPELKMYSDIILYELHHRDFSIDPNSGIEHKGKFLALTETGTKTPEGESSGLDHLKELGVTHIHILPSFDFATIDERKLEKNKYNWGYDPLNYNVPDGSYSTDPYQPATRVKEFKQMVQALHKAGIRVILDVVYNHTFNTAESNFERTVPGYFYRQKEDGTLANGSGCGNETASERPMMRKFMIESVLYWIKEYHIDGFRFDLMGVHDIETMNEIRKAVNKVDPTICIYGEGWAADTPQYPADSLAMKGNVSHMPGIAVFSDELRDGLCGPVWKKEKGAFLAGVPGAEMSVKFGIVGAIEHPQVRCDSVNYSQKPWAEQPTQMISYVSCHDGLCLVDRLKASMPGATPEQLVRLDKLAQTVVFTSQGIPFIYAGEEVMRDKQGVDNSYKSPDAVNAIDWRRKTTNGDVFMYYKRLIDLRKSHPAFRMGDAEKVRKHLEFLPVEGQNLIAFRLKDHANGDSWEDIIVAFNSRMTPARLEVPVGKYTVVCKDGVIDVRGLGTQIGPEVIIPGQSALIMYK